MPGLGCHSVGRTDTRVPGAGIGRLVTGLARAGCRRFGVPP